MGDSHGRSLKRKLNAPLPFPRKRSKHNDNLKKVLSRKKSSQSTVAVNADELPWTTVQIGDTGDDGQGDILEFEEVEDVEVFYTDDGKGGKVVGFRVLYIYLEKGPISPFFTDERTTI